MDLATFRSGTCAFIFMVPKCNDITFCISAMLTVTTGVNQTNSKVPWRHIPLLLFLPYFYRSLCPGSVRFDHIYSLTFTVSADV